MTTKQSAHLYLECDGSVGRVRSEAPNPTFVYTIWPRRQESFPDGLDFCWHFPDNAV